MYYCKNSLIYVNYLHFIFLMLKVLLLVILLVGLDLLILDILGVLHSHIFHQHLIQQLIQLILNINSICNNKYYLITVLIFHIFRRYFDSEFKLILLVAFLIKMWQQRGYPPPQPGPHHQMPSQPRYGYPPRMPPPTSVSQQQSAPSPGTQKMRLDEPSRAIVVEGDQNSLRLYSQANGSNRQEVRHLVTSRSADPKRNNFTKVSLIYIMVP
uniref:Uncharacterized protein n=1 Tax=Heterorhabditis bacteriophora TaxID=37862 RepID=A0A1I7WX31_HETBA